MDNPQAIVVTEHETVLLGEAQPTPTVITTGQIGPPGPSKLSRLDDVDMSELVPGATLIYQANNNNWKATKLLDNQIIECGQF